MGAAQTKPGCATTTTTVYLKRNRYKEVEPLLQPILRDAASWSGLMSATVSKVSEEELSKRDRTRILHACCAYRLFRTPRVLIAVIFVMYESTASMEANSSNISAALAKLDAFMSWKPDRKVGVVSHCVGLGVGPFNKASMPAAVMTPTSSKSAQAA